MTDFKPPLARLKGGFPDIAEITHSPVFTKEINDVLVLAANISMEISIVKIIFECFLP